MKLGVSGHQRIEPVDLWHWVEHAMRCEIMHSKATVGISCLALGADQLFASLILEFGLQLHAIVPCRNYEDTFEDSASKENYFALLNRAAKTVLLDFDNPSEIAFLKAGQVVVNSSERMIFVWDGKPAEGTGGTEDIVAYTRRLAVPYAHLNPFDRSIHYA